MLKKRLIACLLVRDGLIVQSIGFRRYLPIGRPPIAVEFVARWDVDEIVLLDISASAQGRGPDTALIGLLSERCFVPITVGGGIHSLQDMHSVIRNGADKVCTNSEALTDPDFISRAADRYGSQCVVVSMDVKRHSDGRYEVWRDGGRVPTGKTPSDWAHDVQSKGAGEIFLNSIDRDGEKKGYDLELIASVANAVEIPVIACGGVGKYSDFAPAIIQGGASAAAAGNIFHYIEHSTIVAKAHLLRAGVDVRLDSAAQYRQIEFDEQGRLLRQAEDTLEGLFFERFKNEAI